LGLNPTNEGHVLRINIPKPTEEKRKELVKIINEEAENCRISLRNERQTLHQQIKNMKQNSEITEDDFYKYEKTIKDTLVDFNNTVDELTQSKEQELMTI